MGSLGATSPRRPPSHHELQSDPYKMRVFLAVLLLATARADKPAVAPAYTGAATVDETFGSALKRDAPAAAAPDSYGSPVAAPAQDTYGSPSAPIASNQPDSFGSPAAPVVAQQDSYGSPQAPVQTAPQSAGPGNQGYYYYYYPVRQNVPEAQSSDDGGLLGGLFDGGLAGILTTKALLLILGLAGFVLITTIGIGFGRKRSFSSRALSLASPYMTSGNLIALLESVNSAITKYQ